MDGQIRIYIWKNNSRSGSYPYAGIFRLLFDYGLRMASTVILRAYLLLFIALMTFFSLQNA